MSRYTEATLTVALEDKSIEQTGLIGIRETVKLTLSGVEEFGHSDLALLLVHGDTLLASCDEFDDAFQGLLSTNTEELVAFFDGRAHQSRRWATCLILDLTNQCELANDRVALVNNPYEDGMSDPTAAEPVGGGEAAPAAKGVTNGDTHDHSGGDGAQIDHTTLANKGTNTHAAIDAALAELAAGVSFDGAKVTIAEFYLLDITTGKKARVYLDNGALKMGVQV